MRVKPVESSPVTVPDVPVQDLPASPAGAGRNDEHFSLSLQMEHWFSLLTICATLLLLIGIVAVVVRLMMGIGHTLLLFSLGGLLAYAIDPLVERLRARPGGIGVRMSRTASAMLIFAGVLLILVGAALALSKTMAHQVDLLGRDHVVWEAKARETLRRTDLWLAQHSVRLSLTTWLNHPPPSVKTWSEGLAKGTIKLVTGLSRGIVEGVIVGLIALYFLIYCKEMREKFVSAMPGRFRPYVSNWQDDVNQILGGFVRGQLILALIIGGMGAVLCLLLGIKLWLLIGLFVVVASLVPVFGPYIGAVPAVAAALLAPHGMLMPGVKVAIIIVAFGIINEVGSKVLYPRLVGAALGLHEVLVLFVLFAGLEVGGITGVLFAAPLTALAGVTIAQLYRFWQGQPPHALAGDARRAGAEMVREGAP